jgi:hypothetical protein
LVKPIWASLLRSEADEVREAEVWS